MKLVGLGNFNFLFNFKIICLVSSIDSVVCVTYAMGLSNSLIFNPLASLSEAREIHSSVIGLSDGDRLILNNDLSLTHLVKSPEGWTQQ